jgi:hypothetical protein
VLAFATPEGWERERDNAAVLAAHALCVQLDAAPEHDGTCDYPGTAK